MEILIEYCYGSHSYFKVKYNNKKYEIDWYIRENGESFQVSDETMKDELITELKKVW